MDWSSIEQDFRSQTHSTLRGQTFQGTSNPYPPRPPEEYRPKEYLDDADEDDFADHRQPSRYPTSARQPDHFHISSGTLSDAMQDISEMKSLFYQQSRKQAVIEKMVSNYSAALEATRESEIKTISRIDQVEHELRMNVQSAASIARDRSELAIQSKSLAGRVQQVEALIREYASEYATKDMFDRL